MPEHDRHYERYDVAVKKFLIDLDRNGVIPNNVNSVELSNERDGMKVRIHGFIVEKSIFIPLSEKSNSKIFLDTVKENLKVIREFFPRENYQDSTCCLLKVPYNGNTEGLYTDGQFIEHVSCVHAYFNTHIFTPKGFIDQATKALKTVGTTLTINDSS
jgi:hypothetical protein